MSCWSILGIPQNSDVKNIKKAYAKMLRIYNPDDDPKGYQRLREAYDAAIKYSKKNNKEQQNKDSEFSNLISDSDHDEYTNKDTDKIVVKRSNINYREKNKKQDESIYLKKQLEEFLNKLNIIYSDMSLRIDYLAWKDLLTMDVIWNVYTFPIIEDEIFKFLESHNKLPIYIWNLLNESFNWIMSERELYDKYSVKAVDVFFKEIRKTDHLKYDYLGTLDPVIAEEYLTLRQKAYDALKNGDRNAEQYLNSAYALFNADAELLRLMGKYNYSVEDYGKALKYYNSAFEINNNDLESALYIGSILSSEGNFSEATSYLQLYLSNNSDNDVLAINSIAYCYYYNNDFTMAKNNFLRLRSIIGSNKIIEKYLKNIESQLEGRNVGLIKFKKYSPKVKAIVGKKSMVDKFKSLNKIVVFSCIIFIAVAINIVTISFGHGDEEQLAPPSQIESVNNVENDYNNIENDDTFKAIKTKEELENINYFINIKMCLKNIKPLNYYKLKEAFQSKIILSKEEIDKNNIQDKVESQLFIGNFYGGVIIFADENYEKDKMGKDDTYIVKGAVSTLGFKSIQEIKSKYSTTKDFYWPQSGCYIDCSQKEIDNVKKESKLIEIRDGKAVRVSKTLQDFLDNDYPDLQVLYLTDIIPIDLYVSADKNGDFDFARKAELTENQLATYTQAFVGKMEGRNILFIDKNFSINNIDNNRGCNIYGYCNKFTVEGPIQLPINQGKDSDLINVESSFLYNAN